MNLILVFFLFSPSSLFCIAPPAELNDREGLYLGLMVLLPRCIVARTTYHSSIVVVVVVVVVVVATATATATRSVAGWLVGWLVC